MTKTGTVTVGKIVGVYGLKGWIKLNSYTSPRENIFEYTPWLLQSPKGVREQEIESIKKQGKGIIAKLKGIDDREAAFGMIGAEILINKHQLPELDENEFYWRDLQGLKVLNSTGVELGDVEYLIDTGANDVLVVSKNGQECLIPFLQGDVVKRVDIAAGVIHVEWDTDY